MKNIKKLLLKSKIIPLLGILKHTPKLIISEAYQMMFGEKFKTKRKKLKKKEEKLTLDSITVLENDKAVLRYKKGDFYYNQTINYRRGKITPINITTVYI